MTDTGLRNFIILIVGVFFTLILFGVWLTHWQSLSSKVVVSAVPSVSRVTINGKAAKLGANRVKPGQQKVVVSSPGFTSVTKELRTNKGDLRTLEIVLISNSSSTADWYTRHPADAKAAEGISSRNNDALGQKSIQNAPLITLLPFVSGGFEFRVDYGNEPGDQADHPVIYITGQTSQAQQHGLDWVRSLGYDPSDYNIKFVTAVVQPL